MFDIALGIFLFLSPIFVLPANSAKINGFFAALQFYQFKTLSLGNGIVQYQFFQYGVLILFILALTQKVLRNFTDKNLAWFLGLCALSIVFHPRTISDFIPIFLGILLYYLIVVYAKNIKKLLYIIAGVSTLNTLFAVLQFFGIHLIYKYAGNITGLMCSSSHLGTYQALALPICYTIHPALSIIPLISLLLSKSTTALLASIAGMIYLWFPKRKKIFASLFTPMGLTILFGSLIVLTVRNYHYILCKFTMRLGLWFEILKQIIKKPFGYGLGIFSLLSDKFYSYQGHWEWVYNEYLEIIFCIGIVSLYFIIRFLGDKFNGVGFGIERTIAASCLIVAIICLGQPAMHFARLTGTIIPLFAFLEILKRKERILCS